MEPVLTKNIGQGTTWLEQYEANGGYQGLRKALGMNPADVVALVKDSGLRGRGGAGFPTGLKWASVLPVEQAARPRYLACNFDEMEPGTFKDRILVQGDPHQLIEGMLIAAWACRLDVGYVFLRLEYQEIAEILLRAFGEARDKGYVGKNVLGSGWDFELHIHTSAGRYMAGEETGLLNALEGGPARPRSKPPYPGTSGAWGRPTIINNVETLSCVPHIIERGADWFRGLGLGADSGTKMYGASGKVQKPGCWELPMGSTLREVVMERAGGMRGGHEFRAALPGGASTCFMDSSQLDVPLDFTTLKPLGLYLGTGTVIVLDDKTCPVAALKNLQMFYARESCGWCTPCRDGLPWIEGLLADIEQGCGEPGDVELLLDQAKYIDGNTYCALATGAMFPLVSGIYMFREDFDEHVRTKTCKYGE